MPDGGASTLSGLQQTRNIDTQELNIGKPSPSPRPNVAWVSLLSWAILLAVLVVSWKGAEIAPLTLIQDSGNMATFAADFFPPDFSQWQDYLGEMAVTLQIAVWGTALAVVLSIPFGLMCADNLVPWWIYQPMRRRRTPAAPSMKWSSPCCSWSPSG